MTEPLPAVEPEEPTDEPTINVKVTNQQKPPNEYHIPNPQKEDIDCQEITEEQIKEFEDA